MAKGMTDKHADVIIKVAMQMLQSKAELNKQMQEASLRAGAQFSTGLQNAASKAMNNANMLSAAKFKTKNLVNPDVYKQIQAEYTKMGRTVGGKLLDNTQRWNLAQQKVKKSISDTNAIAKKGKVQFAGWALSIMFFGMALQQLFNTIWKTGKTTFQDVMHSVEDTVTGFDMLEGSMKYMGFTIGEAIEPLALMLVPFIDKISEIVQKNPEMVASITAWGTALGAIFTFGGMGVLAINGFVELGTKVGLIDTELLNLSKSANWTKLGDSATKAMGAIAIGFAIGDAVDSFKDFKDGKWVDGLLNAGASALQGIGGMMLLKSGKGSLKKGSLMIVAGIAMDSASNNQFFQNFGFLSAFLFAKFKTIADYISWVFHGNILQSFTRVIADLAPVADGIMSLFGIDLDDVLNKLIGIESGAFDSSKAFKDNLVLANAELRQMDKEFGEWKDGIQKPATLLNDLKNNELTLSFDNIRQMSFDGTLDQQMATNLLSSDMVKTNLLDDKTTRLLEQFLLMEQRKSGQKTEVTINVNNDMDLLNLINTIKESI